MKILRVFDSLKFVRAIFVAAACVFILNVAHADTTAIQSVIAYGKTEQSATPTPTTPVPIMTNNGELRATKNLFDKNEPAKQQNSYYGISVKKYINGNYWMSIKRKPGASVPSGSFGIIYQLPSAGVMAHWFVSSGEENSAYVPKGSSINFVNDVNFIMVGVYPANATTWKAFLDAYDIQIVPGTKKQPSTYTDGLTETIRDAAGHKATAQMLLSVDDYKDEQNITTGAITRRVGVKVLDGTEDWVVASVSSIRYVLLENTTNSNRYGIISSHFKSDPVSFANMSNNSGGLTRIAAEGKKAIAIKAESYATLNEWKQYLADQYANGTPVIVVYPLVTETTENVAAQSLTTAPVRQTLGAIMNMPIVTTLTDGTVIGDLIRVATTKYNEESFEDVQGALTGVFNAVDTVVTQTMTQAQAIDTIATSKQTRPDEGCSAKYCLLVEDEQGVPHWYPIAGVNGVAHNLPAGYTELQYIESTGTQYINTGIGDNTSSVLAKAVAQQTYNTGASQILFGVNTNGSAGTYFGVGGVAVNWGLGAKVESGMSTIPATTKATIELTFDNRGGTATINGETVSRSKVQSTVRGPLAIFAAPSNGGYYGKYKLWSCEVYQDNVLVRNFVPAKNSNNVVGLYDMVSKEFFTNAGTGTFTAGPDM